MKKTTGCLYKFDLLSDAHLSSCRGGKKGGFGLNISVTWGNIRDTARGLYAGLTGKKRNY